MDMPWSILATRTWDYRQPPGGRAWAHLIGEPVDDRPERNEIAIVECNQSCELVTKGDQPQQKETITVKENSSKGKRKSPSTKEQKMGSTCKHRKKSEMPKPKGIKNSEKMKNMDDLVKNIKVPKHLVGTEKNQNHQQKATLNQKVSMKKSMNRERSSLGLEKTYRQHLKLNVEHSDKSNRLFERRRDATKCQSKTTTCATKNQSTATVCLKNEFSQTKRALRTTQSSQTQKWTKNKCSGPSIHEYSHPLVTTEISNRNKYLKQSHSSVILSCREPSLEHGKYNISKSSQENDSYYPGKNTNQTREVKKSSTSNRQKISKTQRRCCSEGCTKETSNEKTISPDDKGLSRCSEDRIDTDKCHETNVDDLNQAENSSENIYGKSDNIEQVIEKNNEYKEQTHAVSVTYNFVKLIMVNTKNFFSEFRQEAHVDVESSTGENGSGSRSKETVDSQEKCETSVQNITECRDISIHSFVNYKPQNMSKLLEVAQENDLKENDQDEFESKEIFIETDNNPIDDEESEDNLIATVEADCEGIKNTIIKRDSSNTSNDSNSPSINVKTLVSNYEDQDMCISNKECEKCLEIEKNKVQLNRKCSRESNHPEVDENYFRITKKSKPSVPESDRKFIGRRTYSDYDWKIYNALMMGDKKAFKKQFLGTRGKDDESILNGEVIGKEKQTKEAVILMLDQSEDENVQKRTIENEGFNANYELNLEKGNTKLGKDDEEEGNIKLAERIYILGEENNEELNKCDIEFGHTEDSDVQVKKKIELLEERNETEMKDSKINLHEREKEYNTQVEGNHKIIEGKKGDNEMKEIFIKSVDDNEKENKVTHVIADSPEETNTEENIIHEESKKDSKQVEGNKQLVEAVETQPCKRKVPIRISTALKIPDGAQVSFDGISMMKQQTIKKASKNKNLADDKTVRKKLQKNNEPKLKQQINFFEKKTHSRKTLLKLENTDVQRNNKIQSAQIQAKLKSSMELEEEMGRNREGTKTLNLSEYNLGKSNTKITLLKENGDGSVEEVEESNKKNLEVTIQVEDISKESLQKEQVVEEKDIDRKLLKENGHLKIAAVTELKDNEQRITQIEPIKIKEEQEPNNQTLIEKTQEMLNERKVRLDNLEEKLENICNLMTSLPPKQSDWKIMIKTSSQILKSHSRCSESVEFQGLESGDNLSKLIAESKDNLLEMFLSSRQFVEFQQQFRKEFELMSQSFTHLENMEKLAAGNAKIIGQRQTQDIKKRDGSKIVKEL